jgi:hypothetical protein
MACSTIVTLLLDSAVYFGFGPLLYSFGSAPSVRFAETFFPVTAGELARANTLNILGVFITCAVFRAFARPIRRNSLRPLFADRLQLRRAILVFTLIGLGSTYLFILPYELGILTFTLSGSLYNLRVFTYMALFLMAYALGSSAHRTRGIGPLFIGTLLLHVVPTLLTFAKTPVVLALGAAAGGWFLARPRVRVMLMSIALLAAAYLYLVPYMSGGRHLMGGVSTAVGLAERANIARESGADLGGIARETYQLWWVRLNYAPNQTFAMREYDDGRPGSTLATLPYLVVPRILFPGKPIVTNVGNEFNRLISGNAYSSSSPTTYAEGYWNGGWSVFVLVSCYLGFLFAKLTNGTLRGLSAADFRWLPMAYFGVFMGARIDAWFVETYAGSVLFMLTYWAALYFLLGRPTTRMARTLELPQPVLARMSL